MKKTVLRLTLCLLALVASGCGGSDPLDSFNDTFNSVSQSVTQTVTRVTHVNWNTYNVYRYEADAWVPVISQGNVLSLPPLGQRPVMIVHGLGSDIVSKRFDDVAKALQQAGATAILGFEYDTLDAVSKNGSLLVEALNLLTDNDPGRQFSLMGHSMGTLVTRVALESGLTFDIAPTGNRAVLVAGPHLGSEVAQAIQARPNLFQEVLQLLVLNGNMEFRNLDGRRVAVDGQEQGFSDLIPGNSFLTGLNFEAANHHPQFEYRTIAGNKRGTDYEAIARLLGVFEDDGVVGLSSANAGVIGQVASTIGSGDHTTITTNPVAVQKILEFLGF